MLFMKYLLSLVCSVVLSVSVGASAADATTEIQWLDLMPQEDIDAMENMPEITHENPFDRSSMPEVMFSSKVVDAYENKQVRIAGYMVPLETNNKGELTEFFLAPYMGACIHVPPPPPNQMIHVKFPKGAEVEGIWYPFIIEGKLKLESFDNGMGASSYSMTATLVKPYEE
jgi:hypothetical protein